MNIYNKLTEEEELIIKTLTALKTGNKKGVKYDHLVLVVDEALWYNLREEYISIGQLTLHGAFDFLELRVNKLIEWYLENYFTNSEVAKQKLEPFKARKVITNTQQLTFF